MINLPFLKWPAVAFWLSIVFGASGILSGFAVTLIASYLDYTLPSVTDAIDDDNSRIIVLIFMGLTAPFLIGASYKTRTFIGKSSKKALQAQLKIISILDPIHLVSCIVMPASYILMYLIGWEKHPVLHNILISAFSVSQLGFQVTTDMIYAVSTDTMIKVAWVTDIIHASFFCGAVLFKFLNIVTKDSDFCHSIFVVCQLVIFILGFFKLIFTGIVVLGARFIDSNFEILKKEKQTIFDENYGMA
ncbi:hypothetical protein TVAG_455120 [Trichomonas vaginalis G3]|uniref:Uncharacterized protein n=1 Tax=Trichomonas vaginalis (strain ATCC PRA-98 / G3) TaxID=412133 RepID=A2FMX4_TRIV3|nr:hypothetical protein TVAGG3_0387520 [Trichomonas vaginalis G3]EAX93742.1 hypothetical protein TVAG_455120 [Trichomonas vaginalis G3]KAI5533757.1 hypothetical protein TVAGG3_0387520 [Trichomonas vaginalis G3]|eukprot:XP_001306672.1 hypothetical protein [Trichomonas vaginalis G3]